MQFFTQALASAGLLAAANAHMQLITPKPFPSQGKALGPKQPANRPLDAHGADFPCKYTGPDTFTGGPVNEYPTGSTQTLQVKGSAVHGGGSCQISVTYDKAPTKQSVWKVIHSIEGGCPARNKNDNYIEDDPEFVDPNTYKFKIPTELPDGEGVIAWTWNNKIGNREFYMNCGSVKITGGSGTKETYNSLPDMAIINIPEDRQNLDYEGKDIPYTHPGKPEYVENNIKDPSSSGGFSYDNTYHFPGYPTSGDSGTSGTSGGSGGSGGASGGSYPSSSVESAPSSTSAASPPGGGGAYVTQPADSGSNYPASSASADAPAPTSSAGGSTGGYPSGGSTGGSTGGGYPSSGGSSSGGSGSAKTGACTPEGQFNCLSGTSYQQCASGQWSTTMQMAAGTQCSDTFARGMTVTSTKNRRALGMMRALRV